MTAPERIWLTPGLAKMESTPPCEHESGLIEYVRADLTTPSAPLPEAGEDAAVWQLIDLAQACGAKKDEDDNSTWWTLDVPAFYALEAKLRNVAARNGGEGDGRG
jgi:hypothetical protein